MNPDYYYSLAFKYFPFDSNLWPKYYSLPSARISNTDVILFKQQGVNPTAENSKLVIKYKVYDIILDIYRIPYCIILFFYNKYTLINVENIFVSFFAFSDSRYFD